MRARSSSASATGQLVSGIPDDLDPVGGVLGTGEIPLRSAAVNLDGSTAAAVTTSDTVLVGPLNGGIAEMRGILDRSADLLEPAWDFTDRIWLIDRRSDGARVRYYENDRLRKALEVPGITGEDDPVLPGLPGRVAPGGGRRGPGRATSLVVRRIRHRAEGDSAAPRRPRPSLQVRRRRRRGSRTSPGARRPAWRC